MLPREQGKRTDLSVAQERLVFDNLSEARKEALIGSDNKPTPEAVERAKATCAHPLRRNLPVRLA